MIVKCLFYYDTFMSANLVRLENKYIRLILYSLTHGLRKVFPGYGWIEKEKDKGGPKG